MINMDNIILFLILAISFFIRTLPRLLHPNAIVSDTYFHLYRAQTIRDAGFRLTKKLPRVILPHENTYPFLYHYLLALFPGNARLWAERLTGAFFDTCNALLIYIFTHWLIWQNFPGGEYAEISLMVTALYAFSPALLRIGSGPRAYNGSPRIMGQTLYLIHIFSAIIFLETGWYVFAGLSVLAGALLIVTAKFAVQVLVFFGLFISFAEPVYFFIVIFAFLTSIMVTAGKSLFVLKGQINHSLNYVKHLQKIFLHPYVQTLKEYLTTCLTIIYYILILKFKKAADIFFRDNYPLHLLAFVYPQFILCGFILLHQDDPIFPRQNIFIAWIISGMFWFLLTKLRPMMFLGEGERYLEYAIYPSFLLVTLYFFKEYKTIFFLWLLFCALSAIYYIKDYCKNYRLLDELFGVKKLSFNQLPKDRATVIWPIGSHHFEVLYLSNDNHFILTHGTNIDEKIFSNEDFMLVYGKYPYPSSDWNKIITTYDVSYIASSPSAFDYYMNTIADSPDVLRKRLIIVDSNESFVLYQIVDASGCPAESTPTG